MIAALEAARIVEWDYRQFRDRPIVDRLCEAGRCFSIVEHAAGLIGICRGTTDFAGWLFNLRAIAKAWPGVGEAGDRWHGGWLENAVRGAGFFRDRGIGLLIGHSKGAAEAQIIALSLGIDAITFCAPKPLLRPVRRRAMPVIVNHCRTDDIVCRAPLLPGYRRVGRTIWHRPLKRHWGEDHRIRHMIDMLDGSEACEMIEEAQAT